MGIIYGTEKESMVKDRGQVYKATHTGEGLRLPHAYRSFISFSYGGKWIEDFGLIAVTDGDRLSHAIYADFEDVTEDPEVYDGQHYWDTHFKANAWDLKLATDGITDNQLNEFRQWFAPGIIKELILAEHPNRGIMARISASPTYDMLPFEHEIEKKIAGETITTKTTLYKGEISLSFVMDDPYWYAIKAIVSNEDIIETDGGLVVSKTDARGYNDNDTSGKLIRLDMRKIIEEDGIIWRPAVETANSDLSTPYLFIIGTPVATGRAIDRPDYFDTEGRPINWGGLHPLLDEYAYAYYCGTGPCLPEITLKLYPRAEAASYIQFPYNSYSYINNPYNSITFIAPSGIKTLFKFTTPGIYTGYNQAMSLLNSFSTNISWAEATEMLRDNIKHFAPRAFIMRLLDYERSQSAAATISTDNINNIKDNMANFIKSNNRDEDNLPAIVIINSKTGRAWGKFEYNSASLTTDGLVYTKQTVEEDVGDMIKSDYIKLEERNYPDENGYIQTTNCYEIRFDAAYPMFNMTYQNLYL